MDALPLWNLVSVATLLGMTQIEALAEQIAQTGRDEMAQLLADLLATSTTESQHYRDGIEDALQTLVNAGATDPR